MAIKKVTTQKSKGLITLGDYRRVARQSLFSHGFSKSKSTSMYDAVCVALSNIPTLLVEAYMNKSEIEQWGVIWRSGTEYEMNNEPLFRCVKLMELAVLYSDQNKRDKVFQNWPKRPDKDIKVFTSVGLSYLEATFDFVEERGRDIIHSLQNAYILHLNSKGKRGVFTGPIEFLSNTPEIDKLRILQEPDPIIKAWYNRILATLRTGFPSSEYTPSRREVEFKDIYKQLEYERTKGIKPPVGDIAGLIYEKLKTLPEHKAMTVPEISEWLVKEHKAIIDDTTILSEGERAGFSKPTIQRAATDMGVIKRRSALHNNKYVWSIKNV